MISTFSNEKYQKGLTLLFTAIIVLLFQGCLEDIDEKVYTYSFEHDMQEWKPIGLDLDNPPVTWSINRTNNISFTGTYSLQFYLNNVNDAGKIWIEKQFNITRYRNYNITISYKFATSD
jgi:hypothetical protein